MWPRNSASRILIFTALAALSASLPVAAQRQGFSYISYSGSEVSLVSSSDDGTTAQVNTPVLPGDKVDTGSSSRAEIILADGNIVRIDARSSLRFDRIAHTYESDDVRNLFYIERGGISVENRFLSQGDQPTRIDTENATIQFGVKGLLRIDTGRRGTEVYIQSGRADVLTRSGRSTLYAGDYAFVNDRDEIEIDRWEFPKDRFTRFIEERLQRIPNQRPAYVDAEYGYDYYASDLDTYGSWSYVESVGQYAWRPSVGADWTPYSLGYWRYTPSGLCWVSSEPWGWMPYHYGSWSFQAGLGWCWMAANVFSPAWVYWTYTPSWVGWCPMGYYGYSPEYRRHMKSWGYEGSSGHYAHLWGRIDISRIDRTGWNFVSSAQVGGRFGRNDVRRGDRVDFHGEHVGVIATAPLRVERASRGSVTVSVQEAIRRVPLEGGGASVEGRGSYRGTAPVNEGLTALLRREGNLSAASQEELRRATVRVGQDPAYRSTTAEALSAPVRRVEAGPAGTRGSGPEGRGTISSSSVPAHPSRGGVSGSIAAEIPTSSGKRSEVRPSETWRESGSRGSETPRRELTESATGTSASRREGSTTAPVNPGSTDRQVRREGTSTPRSDEGWRSPGTSSGSMRATRSPESPAGSLFTFPDSRSTGTRTREVVSPETPRSGSTSSSPSVEAPRSDPSTPASRDRSVTRPESPRSSSQESWRRDSSSGSTVSRREESSSSTPRQGVESRGNSGYTAPRPEAPAAPAAPRSYEVPRPAVQAPRYEAVTAPRSYEAPRPAAPAPRVEAPRPESRPAAESRSAKPN